MNVTLSIPDALLEESRKVAEARGISLNQMIREELERLTARDQRQAALEELRGLWDDGGGDSRGWEWNREELHERSQLP
jgi:hypothetical protein